MILDRKTLITAYPQLTVSGGKGAHWRAIYDDKGRVMVGISYNSDMGDAWEYADSPYYPEPMTGLATRIALNSIVYAMTH